MLTWAKNKKLTTVLPQVTSKVTMSLWPQTKVVPPPLKTVDGSKLYVKVPFSPSWQSAVMPDTDESTPFKGMYAVA
jgi:hypothetical protein